MYSALSLWLYLLIDNAPYWVRDGGGSWDSNSEAREHIGASPVSQYVARPAMLRQ